MLNTRDLNLHLVIIKIIPFISKEKNTKFTNSNSPYEEQVIKAVRQYRYVTVSCWTQVNQKVAIFCHYLWEKRTFCQYFTIICWHKGSVIACASLSPSWSLSPFWVPASFSGTINSKFQSGSHCHPLSCRQRCSLRFVIWIHYFEEDL